MNTELNYLVTICGGIGPDVWDNEIQIKAKNIREALDIAEKSLQGEDVSIVGISQDD